MYIHVHTWCICICPFVVLIKFLVIHLYILCIANVICWFREHTYECFRQQYGFIIACLLEIETSQTSVASQTGPTHAWIENATREQTVNCISCNPECLFAKKAPTHKHSYVCSPNRTNNQVHSNHKTYGQFWDLKKKKPWILQQNVLPNHHIHLVPRPPRYLALKTLLPSQSFIQCFLPWKNPIDSSNEVVFRVGSVPKIFCGKWRNNAKSRE